VPVIGWMWYFLEIVFCQRKWEEDRSMVAQSLQRLWDYPENYWVGCRIVIEINISLKSWFKYLRYLQQCNTVFYWHKFLLFCEGTRFTPKKHQISMQVAESKGLPKLKYHLLPRTKGFWVTVQNLRGAGEFPSVSLSINVAPRNVHSCFCELNESYS